MTAANSLHMAFDCDVILGGYVGGYLEDWIGGVARVGGGTQSLRRRRNLPEGVPLPG